MNEALRLARASIEAGGRPFGAVLVRDRQVIARAVNEVVQLRSDAAWKRAAVCGSGCDALAAP